MISSLGFCCFCISLRLGCIILALLQIVRSLLLPVLHGVLLYNGHLHPMTGLGVFVFVRVLVMGVQGLKGSLEREERGVRVLSRIFLGHLIGYASLFCSQLAFSIYYRTQVCHPRDTVVCKVLNQLGIAMVVTMTMFIIEFYFFLVARSYANVLQKGSHFDDIHSLESAEPLLDDAE
ncbi:hypothetical protein DSO57_1031030 [Entomophthora muscae]|uniref:Uncharacterized protein n=1 Tax=Entomophthora muscae TaxID=34485 RepID=A0ACC2S2V6_9FUNG|nr:hypothetical protein DSO57_1031030 [Entomophthora muscae]